MLMQNLKNLREALRTTGTDMLVLGPGAHMDWLLGFHAHPDERPCLLFVTLDDCAFLMPALNAEDISARSEIDMHTWDDAEGPDSALRELLAHLAPKDGVRIALDETMRADFAFLVTRRLSNPEIEFTDRTLAPLRMVKDRADLDEIKRNAAIADEAMEAAFAHANAGMTEKALADIVRSVFREHGAAPLFTIVGASENGAFPHHQTGDRTLRLGDVAVIDIGARSGRFSSDITRMLAIGEPPEDYAKVHKIVEQAVQAAMKAAQPGVLAREVDNAARDVVEEAGYGPQFVHRTGHGMGLEGHEPPYITSTSDTRLQAGMVFTIEPGIYLPGRFGIRLEEVVALTESGPEIQSRLSRDLYICEA